MPATKPLLLYSYHRVVSSFSLEEVFIFTKEIGFDGIDYVAGLPELIIPPHRILEKSKQHKFPILGVHVPLWFILFTPSILFKKIIQQALFFPEIKIFNVHLSGFTYPFLSLTHKVNEFIRLLPKKSLIVSFESNPLFFPLQLYPKITYEPDAFANYAIANKLPINFDTSHIASFNYDVVEFYKKYHKYIQMIHLSDFKNGVEHMPLGVGALPLKNLLVELKKTHYSGVISFEIFKFPKGTSTTDKKLLLQKSIQLVKKYL